MTRNINALRRYIDESVPALSDVGKGILNRQLDNLDFDVTITGLENTTIFAESAIVDSLKNRVLNEETGIPGIKGTVKFLTTDI